MSQSPDCIIDRRERRRLVPYSDVHVLRLERAGKFPRRIQLGPNRVGWLLSEVQAWIESRLDERKSVGGNTPAISPRTDVREV